MKGNNYDIENEEAAREELDAYSQGFKDGKAQALQQVLREIDYEEVIYHEGAECIRVRDVKRLIQSKLNDHE